MNTDEHGWIELVAQAFQRAVAIAASAFATTSAENLSRRRPMHPYALAVGRWHKLSSLCTPGPGPFSGATGWKARATGFFVPRSDAPRRLGFGSGVAPFACRLAVR